MDGEQPMRKVGDRLKSCIWLINLRRMPAAIQIEHFHRTISVGTCCIDLRDGAVLILLALDDEHRHPYGC